MAWGVFTFSKDGRQRLAVVLRALLIAQLVLSLCMVIFCYNSSIKVLFLLRNIHKGSVVYLYGLILLQAYCMKLHYTSGLRLISWYLRCPYWERVAWISRVWVISGSCVAINGMLVYFACRCTLKALMRELSSSLRIGISQYLTEPTWKQLMDTMQIELSCCGAEKSSDWHEIPWINLDFLNEDSYVAMELAGEDGKVLPPVTPFSCCTPHILTACYHDPLQQDLWLNGSVRDGTLMATLSLHAGGCVDAVHRPLAKALMALQLFNMLVFLFQIMILILTALLWRSARDAVLSGDLDGPGRGYLFGSLGPAVGPPYRIRTLKRQAGSCAGAGRVARRRRRAPRVGSYPYLS